MTRQSDEARAGRDAGELRPRPLLMLWGPPEPTEHPFDWLRHRRRELALKAVLVRGRESYRL